MGLFDFNLTFDLGKWPWIHPKPKVALLVEDDADDSLMMARAAEMAGVEIEVAVTAEEALGILHRNGRRFVLVVIDVGLPGIDGWELRQHLIDSWPKLRVVMVSGSVESFIYQPRGELVATLLKDTEYGNLFRDL